MVPAHVRAFEIGLLLKLNVSHGIHSQISFRGYKPVTYTHPSIIAQPYFADEDLWKYEKHERPMLNFNTLDKSVNYDRQSFMGHYNVVDGIPQ